MPNRRGSREPGTLAPGDELVDEATGERYRVSTLIGQGGMGRVFKADVVRTGEVVAVKCNQPIDPTNAALMERTRREGEFLKRLRRHPHIVPVLATGTRDDGMFWMVMPYLDGASVDGLLAVLGRLPLPWALAIASAVLDALAEAHRYAIHRDIKPANVFVTRDGGIWVLDFGAGKFYSVGRLTSTGVTLGTAPYSSPEQLTDPDHLDGRSDLFSVGILTFEMLTGEHPFRGDGPLRDNPFIIANRIIREPSRSLAALAPELPPYVAEIVGKLLEKDRERRSRSAAEATGIFNAALGRLRERVGELPPIGRMFEVYDAARRALELEHLAVQDTERSIAQPMQTGRRARFGTVPLGVLPPPASLPEPGNAEEPAEIPSTGAEVHIRPSNEDPRYVERKLHLIERLIADDTPETCEVLLLVLGDPDESPVVRAGAAAALQVVGDEACFEALEDRAAGDPDPVLRHVCAEAAVKLALRLGLAVDVLPALPLDDDGASPPAEPPQPPAAPPAAATAPARQDVPSPRLWPKPELALAVPVRPSAWQLAWGWLNDSPARFWLAYGLLVLSLCLLAVALAAVIPTPW